MKTDGEGYANGSEADSGGMTGGTRRGWKDRERELVEVRMMVRDISF